MLARIQILFSALLLLSTLSFGSGCSRYLHPSTTENKSQPISPRIDVAGSPTAASVAETIEPYQEQLTGKMNEVLGNIPTSLKKDRPESGLGNWLADLLQRAGKAYFPNQEIAFAVQNSGGIRVGELAAGELTVGAIYELMPFDNELVAVEMNGFVLNEFINHMAADGGWPSSKELRYRIEDGQAKDIMISGEAIEFNRNYVVLLPDYVANGGSDSKMLTDRQQYKSGQLIRDLIIKTARDEGGPFVAELDGRVSR